MEKWQSDSAKHACGECVAGGGQVSRCLTLPPGSKGGITDGWDQVSAEERGGSAPGMHMSHLTHIWLAAKHRTTLAGQRTDGREEGAAPSGGEDGSIAPFSVCGSAGALQLEHIFTYMHIQIFFFRMYRLVIY